MLMRKPSKMSSLHVLGLVLKRSTKHSPKAEIRKRSKSVSCGLQLFAHAMVVPETIHTSLRTQHISFCLQTCWGSLVDLLLISATAIAKCYGTNCTKIGVRNHYKRDIQPNVNAIQDALDRGDDPKDIAMMENVRDGKIGTGQTASSTSITYTLHVFLSDYSDSSIIWSCY
jgi:hypothetical protein